MADIIRVNFKTKERLPTFKIKQYECSICFHTYNFNSLRPNTKPIVMENNNEYYCFSCVKAMYNMLAQEAEARGHSLEDY